jgi:hypothetical protein
MADLDDKNPNDADDKMKADSGAYKKIVKKPLQAPADTAANYTKTADPDVYMGKHGATIKRSDYEQSLKKPDNNMKFNTFEDYADYTGSYARPITPVSTPTKTIPQSAKNGKQIALSDKAMGKSNNFYPPSH